MSAVRIHATTVAIDGCGVLLLGASGSGKSDLALRLIDRGALLVSDDYTELTTIAGTLHAAAPATISGKIEARGLGILTMPHIGTVAVGLAVQLDGAVVRMPDADVTLAIAGIALPVIALSAFEASAPIKVELALRFAREAV